MIDASLFMFVLFTMYVPRLLLRVYIFMLKLKIIRSLIKLIYGFSSNDAYPVVVAAHRQNPNQLALGLSNGGVIVVEPVPPGISKLMDTYSASASGHIQ